MLSLSDSNWSKSATGITERPANVVSGIIINISPNLESISVYKLLETIEISSIINNSSSDNLFLKAALDFSFKPSNFFLGFISKSEWIMVPPIFPANIPVGPSKRTRGFSGWLQW